MASSGCSGCVELGRSRPSTYNVLVAVDRAALPEPGSLELPVEELLRRARPLPPHREMVIEDLSADEGDAFLAALDS